ncbi:MAG: LemA family protein [Elusimicrobiales bacterium]|jgi:LemA protein
MKKGLLIVLGVVVILGLWMGSGYNKLVSYSEAVPAAWSQVETVLQRRYDLIPNLVNTVKGYAKHEKDLLTEVTRLRSQWGEAKSQGQKIEAANGLETALNRLMVVVEQYPQLKANENFIRLQDELAGTENRISVERMRYNETVNAYNVTVRRFPSNILAGLFGFEKSQKYFEGDKAAQQAPQVQF